MESIHQRIKRLRISKGMTLEGLAKCVGVTWQTVQQWERDGGTAPKRARQKAVADALGVGVIDLVSDNQDGVGHVEHLRKCPSKDSNAQSSPPTSDEQLILAALPLLSEDMRENWIEHAKKLLARQAQARQRDIDTKDGTCG